MTGTRVGRDAFTFPLKRLSGDPVMEQTASLEKEDRMPFGSPVCVRFMRVK